MGAVTIEAREVTTFLEGTLAIVRGLGEQEEAMGVAFFDRNRSGALDEGDQKILIDPLVCPKGAKKLDDQAGKTFCIAPVTKTDVDRYSQAIGGIFKKAWGERTALAKEIKPQSAGLCSIDATQKEIEGQLPSATLQVRFQPTFSVRTRAVAEPKRYTVKELAKIYREAGEDGPAVDPARCAEAESSVKAMIRGQEQSLRMFISSRPLGALYVGLPGALGLREQTELPRLSYGNGGAMVHHFNVK
jgi:hypothetical protein